MSTLNNYLILLQSQTLVFMSVSFTTFCSNSKENPYYEAVNGCLCFGRLCSFTYCRYNLSNCLLRAFKINGMHMHWKCNSQYFCKTIIFKKKKKKKKENYHCTQCCYFPNTLSAETIFLQQIAYQHDTVIWLQTPPPGRCCSAASCMWTCS